MNFLANCILFMVEAEVQQRTEWSSPKMGTTQTMGGLTKENKNNAVDTFPPLIQMLWFRDEAI